VLRWRVVHQRIEHPTSNDESTVISDGNIVIAQGMVDAAKP